MKGLCVKNSFYSVVRSATKERQFNGTHFARLDWENKWENKMRLSAIVACSKNRVIGRQDQIPWHLSSDLQRFKKLTMGHTLIMGRKTHESIGRVLPGRTNIILSTQKNYRVHGALSAISLEDALEMGKDQDEVFIIGGERVYREALPFLDRIYLTLIDAIYDGDAYFPEYPSEQFHVLSEEIFSEPFLHQFQILERKRFK